MRPPAEFRGLRALTDKAVDRPGVDEFARFLRRHRDLSIALGDMDGLYAETLGETGPIAPCAGNADVHSGVPRQIDQGPLDEMRHEARIGTVGQDRGWTSRKAPAQGKRTLAQRIVRASRRRQVWVGVPARPWLDAGIEVKRAGLLAQFDQSRARHVDRQVEQEIATADPGFERGPIVVAGQHCLDKGYAVLGGDIVSARLGRDDRDLVCANVEMAEQQRQDALADAAKADDHQTPGESGVLVVEHDCPVPIREMEPLWSARSHVKPPTNNPAAAGAVAMPISLVDPVTIAVYL